VDGSLYGNFTECGNSASLGFSIRQPRALALKFARSRAHSLKEFLDGQFLEQQANLK
jgi:hypothetical protein